MTLFHATDSPAPRNYGFAKRSQKLFRTGRNATERIKKDIESVCKEMDATRSIINEFVTKALFNDKLEIIT